MPTISVTDPQFGAVADGVTDCTAAFRAAAAYAESLVAGPIGGGYGTNDAGGTVAIRVPAGRYLITGPDAFIRSSCTRKAAGMSWIGDGSGVTTVVYRPQGGGVPSPLIRNEAWLGLRFSGVTFVGHGARPGATFMESPATRNQQDYAFDDVVWSGAWGHGLYLTGTNNNSEFRFRGCAALGFRLAPFIESVDSDQFLNYWFDQFKYWGAHQPIVRMHRGGHVRVFALDASDWCGGLAAGDQRYLFELLGNNHALGVCHFGADGVRVEAKSPNAGLIKCQWPHGAVSLSRVDCSSQSFAVAYDQMVHVDVGNEDGAAFVVRDSDLVGTVRVTYGAQAAQRKHIIKFDACTFLQRSSPAAAIKFDGGAPYTPPVVFTDCRGRP